MTLEELEHIVTSHLIESTGIKEKLKNVDDKINWVLGLIAAAVLVLLGIVLKG